VQIGTPPETVNAGDTTKLPDRFNAAKLEEIYDDPGLRNGLVTFPEYENPA